MIIKNKIYTVVDLSFILDLSQEFLIRILLNSNINIKHPEYYTLSGNELELLLKNISKINPNYSEVSLIKQVELDQKRSKVELEKEIKKKRAYNIINSNNIKSINMNTQKDKLGNDISYDQYNIESIFNLREIANFKQFKKDINGNIILSNTEALSICEGIDLPEVRMLVTKYKNNYNDQEIIRRIKEIALVAINKYGENQMLYFMSLPPATYNFKNVTKIFHELDIKFKKTTNPILRILLGDSKDEKALVSFYKEQNGYNNIEKVLNDIIEIKDKKTSKVIFQIHRSGKLKVLNNIKNIVIKLNFFIQFSENTKKFVINYGLTTGECSVCGLELKDPISIKRGIGPVCYKYYS